VNVVFVFGGLPHYFNKVMNQIHQNPNINVSVIAPLSKSNTIGSGVLESDNNIQFNLVRLQEVKKWYGKPFFNNFYKTISELNADAIVIGWPYFLAFIFNPILLIRLKLKKIKLYSKEIPFTIPAWNESLKDFSNRCAESQKSEKMFQSPFIYSFHKLLRKYLYTFVFDHALLYIKSGIKIISSYGISEKNITVTFNSPDTDTIFENIESIHQKFGVIERIPFRILHIGRLVKWKNVHLLLESVQLLKEKFPQIELVVIGKGEEEANLKSQAESLKINDRVHFMGAMYEGEEQSLEMLKASVYVLAGMGGLSINEAMAHHLPVVCSIADGTEQHLVEHKVNGMVFKDNNLNDLCSTLETMFRSDLKKMGEASYRKIKEDYNLQTVSSLYIKAFLS
jgi:glycosyltransferase involved in cell wall biosynthesis